LADYLYLLPPGELEEEKVGEWFIVTCNICGYTFETNRSVNKFLRFARKEKKPRKIIFDDDQSRLGDFKEFKD